MTAPITTASTPTVAPRPRSHPRSRLRARIIVATLAAIGFAALAWAALVSPLPRLTYNPSDSVAVGWYRIDPLDPRTASLPRPLPVDSIVLVPLLKRVGAVAPQHVCIVAGQVRIDGVPSAAVLPADRLGRPLPSWPQCRQLRPGELFLLSVTNPASFDSRYFGPVSASAVIGVARPIWLETRP